jgi:hypothetical protein
MATAERAELDWPRHLWAESTAMAKSRSVFVSKPNALNEQQAVFWARLSRILGERGLAARTLGETDYPNSGPIEAVRRLLDDCDGAIVLGLSQLEVQQGVLKRGAPAEVDASDTKWPTAWNHIEAAMAYVLRLPMLIIREPGVAGGVFDVGNTDRFIHQAEISEEWLASPKFLQPFNEWLEEVQSR